MNIIELTAPVDITLVQKLSEFEALFDYPLGSNQRFRIDHSPDYTAFYRAMGQAKTWVIESGNIVVAAISASIRTIDFEGAIKHVVYMGDLKIHPDYQSGRVLFKMAEYLRPLLEQDATAAYSVVMDGTKITPEHYTGRLGIPNFKPVAKIHILRFETAINAKIVGQSQANRGYELYRELNPVYTHEPALSQLRSSITPSWFIYNDLACAMAEDTRLAKKLYLISGEELLSSHLSYFAFSDAPSGFLVIQQALNWSANNGFPAMFVALSEKQMLLLTNYLQGLQHTAAAATIYATDNICDHIPINTAEI